MPHDRSTRWKKARPWIVGTLSALAVAIAAFLLWRTLRGYSLSDIVDTIVSIPTGRLLAAVGFAAASYVCLTAFDYLALRHVGRPIRYRSVALASFVSLSIGHSIGFAGLSSGAIRYRFYSHWGASAAEVAEAVVFCGITVALGLATLGGAAILLRPTLAGEITGLGDAGVLALAVACLAVPAGYLLLAGTMRKPLRIWRWQVDIPTLKLAACQIVVGTVNFALVAACLHQALLALADIPYAPVAAVYVIANIGTLITHIPGGTGVIESVVVYLLPQSDIIVGVLVFRCAYFLLPLALGLLLFLATEIVWRRGRASDRHVSAGRRSGEPIGAAPDPAL